jgi:peptidyl-prolyl cis-trans isomerase A (cyclophilin A)
MPTFTLRSYSQRALGFVVATILGATVIALANPSHATVVRFNSNAGSFDVRMYDTATPLSVTNILNYVNDGDFTDSIVHRAENSYSQQPDGSFVSNPFVIQGGDWSFPEGGVLTQIPSNPSVMNEPGISNLRGTMALARQGGLVNSGTNNWFVNTGDNPGLDMVDEGFTVFGRVVNDGMQVVDAISIMQQATIRNQFNQSLGSTFPVHGDLSNGLSRDNFVLFTSVEELNIPDGDADFDGDVDGTDLLYWQRGYGTISDMAADFNGDASVDELDLAIWESNLGMTSPLGAISSVPEPTTLLLLCLGALARPRMGRRLN